MPEILDITPSWSETANMLCEILQRGEDKAWARAEIIRMGKIIDTLKAELEQPE